MKNDFLIDTHILLWYLQGDKRIDKETINIIEDISNKIFISNVSLWEIAIKISIGKLKLNGTIFDLQNLLSNKDIKIIAYDFQDLEKIQNLPFIHQDPFDRLIIAQALNKDLRLISNDEMVLKYFS